MKILLGERRKGKLGQYAFHLELGRHQMLGHRIYFASVAMQ